MCQPELVAMAKLSDINYLNKEGFILAYSFKDCNPGSIGFIVLGLWQVVTSRQEYKYDGTKIAQSETMKQKRRRVGI